MRQIAPRPVSPASGASPRRTWGGEMKMKFAIAWICACACARGGTTSFTVSTGAAEVTLAAGGAASIMISVTPTADSAAVSVSGLPAGIRADPLVIPASHTAGTLILHSDGSESAARLPVTVTATSGKWTAVARFDLELSGADSRLTLALNASAVVVQLGQTDVVELGVTRANQLREGGGDHHRGTCELQRRSAHPPRRSR
jgi:hypothetical protein